MNVLVVKANNRPDGISTKMFDTYIDEVSKVANLNVSIYDVFEEEMPYLGQELFDAIGKLQNGEELLDVESRLLTAKQKAKDAVSGADVVVFAFPLWNLTIPARLHTFFDYISEVGFSFKYNEQGQLVGLLEGKKVVILCASGGVYSTPEMKPLEMAANYVRNTTVGVFGMTLADEVIIEGHNANPLKAEEIIGEGLERVRASIHNLA
ncbi:NAD(P)H-dependent oxidoreductase [Bacillus massiliigorillae]|uniref:NAD(P)H-dependent oxidoreductase n=1 Tax=Bacillus massiliigorillae TaxID=1243664 RepID=UPI00039C968E|nr:NAD(P)H-dependent oxidoreductase [Bacillus massiliigorillae]